ncbi:hypothetical protein NPIL_479811 [Nephila pilipes]|uniref:Uncharacterized protein n=1 Tax=Nephila pilipes TaxID=299642 RepID=A0A8X6QNW4_NEPPI|nr:hypothetical protein NPIL_679871 [Nephila pilipes]GFU35081.1 hypothetical protein NPIL_479811 [Nephila pilipes]
MRLPWSSRVTGNQGSIPEREPEKRLPHPRKAAGTQITHSRLGEVVTKNNDTGLFRDPVIGMIARTRRAASGKPELLGSGGSMVAKLKLKGIDGRAQPGMDSAAQFDSTRENSPGPDTARIDRLMALS